MRIADVRVFLAVVFLVVIPAVGEAQVMSTECLGPLRHVVLRDGFDDRLRELLPRSATLLRQCAVMAEATRLRVIVTLPTSRLHGCRARTTMWRKASVIYAHVEIPVTSDFAELLAHEFEHILEQLEGVDLARLADDGGRGVYRTASGAFETVRARAAGLATRREVLDGPLMALRVE